MLIAIPSDEPGGLDAGISEHFGHCAAFTLVSIEDGEIFDITILNVEQATPEAIAHGHLH